MKTEMILALAAALVFAPAMTTCAADEKPAKDAAAEGAEKPKAPKKKVSSKQTVYAQIDAVKKITAQTQEPIVAFLMPADSPVTPFFKKKILMRKEFKDFVKANCVGYMPKLAVDAKDKKKLDIKKMKPGDREFLEKFGVDPKAVESAKSRGMPEPGPEDLVNYPAVVVVNAEATESVFRMPKLDEEGGFGVWILELTDRLRDAGIEMTIPPTVKKVLDNPMAEANAANAKGKKSK